MHFQRHWETFADASRASLRMDRVDYGGSGDPPSERVAVARQMLKRYRLECGTHGFQLLTKVCGEGYHIRDLYGSRRERDTMTDLLRMLLTSIAHLNTDAKRPRG